MQISRSLYAAALVCLLSPAAFPQEADVKTRLRTVRDLGKDAGSTNIPELEAWLRDPDASVRLEAVKGIVQAGSKASIDPLIAATRDNDAEVQALAVDGLVNFYLPGYVQSRFERIGTKFKSTFSDQNDQIIPAYVRVREDVVAAIAPLVSGGASMESRAKSARAAGVLRGRAALPDLYKGLHSKDSAVMYESLVAIQKVGDPTAAQHVLFLLDDGDERVQIAALETAGLLKSKDAAPAIRKAYRNARSNKIRKTALVSLAIIADPESRPLYEQGVKDKDDGVRAAAWEGIARLKNPSDEAMLRRAFEEEGKAPPRLSQAFGLVNLGRTEVSEFSALQYLVNTLNSRAYRGVAEPLLIELARDAQVRENLYPALPKATREEKIGLARVFSMSGDKNSVAALEKLSRDGDAEVAEASLRALRVLKARLP